MSLGVFNSSKTDQNPEKNVRTNCAEDQPHIAPKYSSLCHPKKVLSSKLSLSKRNPIFSSKSLLKIKQSIDHGNLGKPPIESSKNPNNNKFKGELTRGMRTNDNHEDWISEENNYSEIEDNNANRERNLNEDVIEDCEEEEDEESDTHSTDKELDNTGVQSSKRYLPRSAFHTVKKEKYGLPSIRETITRLQGKEMLQKAQAIEAEFYERLIELRKENEIEVAKIVNRKNAELIAVQKTAELKHHELREAQYSFELDEVENHPTKTIDCILFQIGVPIKVIIKMITPSIMNQLQSVMNKQLENLLKQSSEQREFLIREHEETLSSLKSANESARKEVERNKLLTQELESQLRIECGQSKSLQEKLTKLMIERNEAQDAMKTEIEKEKETSKKLKQLQCDFDQINQRNITLESRYNACVEDHQNELKRIRSDHDKRITAMESELTKNEEKYKVNLENIKKEFNSILEENRLSYERQLETKIKEAETSGYQNCSRTKDAEIKLLHQSIREARELNANNEIKYQEIIGQLKCDITKLNDDIKELKGVYESKENHLLTTITKLQEQQEIIHNTSVNDNALNSIQANFVNEMNPLVELISEKLSNQITQWRQQQIQEAVTFAKQEEVNRLESEFKQKESVIRNELLLKIEDVRNEKNRMIETLTRALEGSKLEVVKLQAELKETRRIALKEVDLRREQLSEISLAREAERKELIAEHERAMSEEQRKSQDSIKQLKQKHADELKSVSSQADEKLIEMEKEYKNRFKEANKRLNESQGKINELDIVLQGALQERKHIQEALSQSHQTEIEQIKYKQQQEILALKEAISKERTRARLAEASLRQQEKAWNDMKARWHEERIAQLGNSLPLETRTHMEATIEALRLQVNLLKKRIAVMEEDRETNLIFPQTGQKIFLPDENSLNKESPVKDQPEGKKVNTEKCKVDSKYSTPLGDIRGQQLIHESPVSQPNLDTYPFKSIYSGDWL
ncbi:unnamed protein product [Heterobilharzia americana]|nr:unnamed protein product [Heterobilharzia americana]